MEGILHQLVPTSSLSSDSEGKNSVKSYKNDRNQKELSITGFVGSNIGEIRERLENLVHVGVEMAIVVRRASKLSLKESNTGTKGPAMIASTILLGEL